MEDLLKSQLGMPSILVYACNLSTHESVSEAEGLQQVLRQTGAQS